ERAGSGIRGGEGIARCTQPRDIPARQVPSMTDGPGHPLDLGSSVTINPRQQHGETVPAAGIPTTTRPRTHAAFPATHRVEGFPARAPRRARARGGGTAAWRAPAHARPAP